MPLILLLLLLSAPSFGQSDDNRQFDIEPSTNIETEKGASAAAMLSVQLCQSGFSGQIVDGGFSVVSSDGFCDQIRLSEVMLSAAKTMTAMGESEYAATYMKYYHRALEDANALIVSTKQTSLADRIASDLLLPALIVVGLILLF